MLQELAAVDTHPLAATAATGFAAAMSLTSLAYGDAAFGEGSTLPAPRLGAWPAGTVVAWIPCLATLLLLLIPDGHLDGTWRLRLSTLAAWGAIAFAAVQSLDDHVFNHAGTDNPLGFSIPFPFQDLLSLAGLVVLGVAFAGALVALPGRLRGRWAATVEGVR